MTGRCPEGYYVTVDVTARLANGELFDYRCVTPMALFRAHAKGPAWIRQAMRKAKFPGRSRIVAIDVRSTLSQLPDGKAWDTL